MTPDQYCEQQTVTARSSFYYSFLFLEPDQRQAMTALYAFCREVDDVVDECSDAGVARTKLDWWRGEISSVYHGAPQHPVAKALQGVVGRYRLPEEHFLEVIDGMEMDLDYDSYPTFRELSLYCYRVAGVVGLMSAEIFGYEDRHTLKYAHDLGLAFQLTNILRDVAEDSRRGRCYIPLDELARFGVTREDLVQGSAGPAVRELLKSQAQRARQYYQQAFQHLPEVDRYRQRTGLIMAAIYQASLDAIVKRDYEVLSERISLSKLRKLWIAWNTARREKRRHLKNARA